MESIIDTANAICAHFSALPQVKSCTIYGSIASNSYDAYSDIDIAVDVSGSDNSIFARNVPELLGGLYPVIFFDYAPSLMPESYVVSIAISAENPFRMVDIKCTATLHFTTLSRADFPMNRADHTLKLFIASLKHMLRAVYCAADITRMHKRVCGVSDTNDPKEMMENVFRWLEENAEPRHQGFLHSLRKFR